MFWANPTYGPNKPINYALVSRIVFIVTFAVSIIGTIGADPPGPLERYRVLHFYRPIPNTLRVDFVLAVLYDDPSLLEVHTGTCVHVHVVM